MTHYLQRKIKFTMARCIKTYVLERKLKSGIENWKHYKLHRKF